MDPDVGGSSPLIHPIFVAPVAQLDRAADFGSACWGFEPSQARQVFYQLLCDSVNFCVELALFIFQEIIY